MKYPNCAAVAAILAVILSFGTSAARATDAQTAALSQCIELSTTGKDRITTAKWMFAAMAESPQLQGAIKVDPAMKDQFDKEMAALFTRLLTVDCAKEAKPIFKSNDSNGIEEASGELGRIAVDELLGDKVTTASLEAFAKYINESDFNALKN